MTDLPGVDTYDLLGGLTPSSDWKLVVKQNPIFSAPVWQCRSCGHMRLDFGVPVAPHGCDGPGVS